MTRTLIFTLILFSFAALAMPTAAQCDSSLAGYIKCGYYSEGYQDGANDARTNRNSDYRRFSDKYERKYENNYRDGYDAGYASVRPNGNRWNFSQRAAYDAGYQIGQNDRRISAGNRALEQSRGGYDSSISLYFQQGYNDGFAGRQRTYDVLVNGNGNPGPFPYPGGGFSNRAQWSGRVDDRVNIIIQGNSIRVETISGSPYTVRSQNIDGFLPRRDGTVTATRTEGRGSVTVIQQPARSNNYTAIVQIYDPKSGADTYGVDITWQQYSGPPVEEPYQPGRVIWRGRVDHEVNITINGSDVQTQNIVGNDPPNAQFSITGYLAHRTSTLQIKKRSGRGSVTVLQYPSDSNDFTAVIQVLDTKGGTDNYEVEISW